MASLLLGLEPVVQLGDLTVLRKGRLAFSSHLIPDPSCGRWYRSDFRYDFRAKLPRSRAMKIRCATLVLSSVVLGGCCDDIDCVNIGEKYDVTFTMEDGVPITKSVKVGEGGGHRGQCGSGETATGWTMDCLRHDACQRYAEDHEGEGDGEHEIRKELAGGLGPNCLDEFGEAIDDYSGSQECKGD
jgi:hypothetical protein